LTKEKKFVVITNLQNIFLQCISGPLAKGWVSSVVAKLLKFICFSNSP